MFMFGIKCGRCDQEIIAPQKTEFLDDKVIRHVWQCPGCKARFASHPRFSDIGKSVRDATTKVDIVPL
jgi:hypothetical protein